LAFAAVDWPVSAPDDGLKPAVDWLVSAPWRLETCGGLAGFCAGEVSLPNFQFVKLSFRFAKTADQSI